MNFGGFNFLGTFGEPGNSHEDGLIIPTQTLEESGKSMGN